LQRIALAPIAAASPLNRSGLDFGVKHRDAGVELHLKNQPVITLPADEWRAAVLAFSEAIEGF
jgi:hypothetical protein